MTIFFFKKWHYISGQSAKQGKIKICCVCRAPWAPPDHPELVLFFSRVYSGWARVIKSEVWASTPFWHVYARVFPSVVTNFGSPPFWHDFNPFWHVAVWCAPECLENTAGGRLFQLVVVVARRKDYVPRRNNGPDPLKRDQYTSSAYHRAWFRDCCKPWWDMVSPGRVWLPVFCSLAEGGAARLTIIVKAHPEWNCTTTAVVPIL